MNKKYRPQTMEDKVDLMLDLLQGNELDDGDEGLIGDVRKQKSEIRELQQFKDRQIWFWMGISFVGGPIVAYLLTLIFKK